MTGLEQKIARHEQKLRPRFENLVKEHVEEDAERKQSARAGAILFAIAGAEQYFDGTALTVEGPVAREVRVAQGTTKHAIGDLPAGVYAVAMVARKKQADDSVLEVNNGDFVTLAAGGEEEVAF